MKFTLCAAKFDYSAADIKKIGEKIGSALSGDGVKVYKTVARVSKDKTILSVEITS